MLGIMMGALSSAPAPTIAQTAVVSSSDAGPRFRADGRDADAYGRNEGYPSCSGLAYVRDLHCRVGAFSNFDTLFPSRAVPASKVPSRLRRLASEPSIRYTFEGKNLTHDDYLDAHPVTGFLIAKGDSILVERYQYGRTDTHRLTSFSMAKTIVGLLVGIAIEEGAIRSLSDLAESYVPGLKDTEYGRTPIKALLQMSSGVFFREDYTDMASDIAVLARLTLGQDPGGSLGAVKRFNTRQAPPGQSFSYSSAESVVLGLVLSGATQRTVSEYASEKLWQPLGAEADAKWIIDATGQEITYANFNAVLRDWARLGLMLGHDGSWQGKSIIPREWLLASTSTHGASPSSKYGYHIWLHAADRRTLCLRGLRGQFVLIDPDAKLVLVQTAISGGGLADRELFALWSATVAQLR
jgi:CubicO group peptidase (beta-lactamase class C family)